MLLFIHIGNRDPTATLHNTTTCIKFYMYMHMVDLKIEFVRCNEAMKRITSRRQSSLPLCLLANHHYTEHLAQA